ncbi:NUDIX hydrolase [Candidatus Methylocalor cossyra]|uniref:Phosphatase NudJ n=1 Tax=Candidatus Methylocalor cossyra TaxID=3108543 RepID=A0ABM9NKU3_9GAMM
MYQSKPSEVGNFRPRVTVAVLAQREGRLLFVEERDDRGMLVINQPAGHVEGGESLIEAAIRETLEETGWTVRPEYLVGCYLWGSPDRTLSYLRVAIAACPERHDAAAPLDAGIARALWLAPEELAACRERHRSPLVLRCVADYLAGERYPLSLFKTLPS